MADKIIEGYQVSLRNSSQLPNRTDTTFKVPGATADFAALGAGEAYKFYLAASNGTLEAIRVTAIVSESDLAEGGGSQVLMRINNDASRNGTDWTALDNQQGTEVWLVSKEHASDVNDWLAGKFNQLSPKTATNSFVRGYDEVQAKKLKVADIDIQTHTSQGSGIGAIVRLPNLTSGQDVVLAKEGDGLGRVVEGSVRLESSASAAGQAGGGSSGDMVFMLEIPVADNSYYATLASFSRAALAAAVEEANITDGYSFAATIKNLTGGGKTISIQHGTISNTDNLWRARFLVTSPDARGEGAAALQNWKTYLAGTPATAATPGTVMAESAMVRDAAVHNLRVGGSFVAPEAVELNGTFAATRGGLSIGGIDQVAVKVASGAPGTGDDQADGFSVGSFWIKQDGSRIWLATAVGAGAAAWQEIYRSDQPRVHVSTTNTAPTSADNGSQEFAVGSRWMTADGTKEWLATAVSNTTATWKQVRGASGVTTLWSGSASSGTINLDYVSGNEGARWRFSQFQLLTFGMGASDPAGNQNPSELPLPLTISASRFASAGGVQWFERYGFTNPHQRIAHASDTSFTITGDNANPVTFVEGIRWG